MNETIRVYKTGRRLKLNNNGVVEWIDEHIVNPVNLPNDDVAFDYIYEDVELDPDGDVYIMPEDMPGMFFTAKTVNSVSMNAQEIWELGIFKDKFNNFDEFLKERKERMPSYGFEATQYRL